VCRWELTTSHSDEKIECTICKDEFAAGVSATQLPCSHLYHRECIGEWLKKVCPAHIAWRCALTRPLQHNSCPVCRFELPTDDPDYDQARAARAQQRPPPPPPPPAGPSS
jgi:E3 ubiquitin-protein ligase RNF115/126